MYGCKIPFEFQMKLLKDNYLLTNYSLITNLFWYFLCSFTTSPPNNINFPSSTVVDNIGMMNCGPGGYPGGCGIQHKWYNVQNKTPAISSRYSILALYLNLFCYKLNKFLIFWYRKQWKKQFNIEQNLYLLICRLM